VRPLRIFLTQFNSLVVWILILAGVLSSILADVVDALAIFLIPVLFVAVERLSGAERRRAAPSEPAPEPSEA